MSKAYTSLVALVQDGHRFYNASGDKLMPVKDPRDCKYVAWATRMKGKTVVAATFRVLNKKRLARKLAEAARREERSKAAAKGGKKVKGSKKVVDLLA